MRLVACLTVCVIPVVANAAQTESQLPSDPQAYCVNRGADFYPYTGEPCKSGYQLGSGNCRKADGHWAAVPREQCIAMAALSNCRSNTDGSGSLCRFREDGNSSFTGGRAHDRRTKLASHRQKFGEFRHAADPPAAATPTGLARASSRLHELLLPLLGAHGLVRDGINDVTVLQ
jgi:hypothetical protein